jgi:hypothetical protein
MDNTNRYRLMTETVSLPADVKWEFVEISQDIAYLRPDLPVSASRHGVIVTSRPLTARECRRKVEVA